MNSIGIKVKELRKKAELTQIDFAKRIGITQGYLSSVEKGDVNDIGSNIVVAIRREFGIDITIDDIPQELPEKKVSSDELTILDVKQPEKKRTIPLLLSAISHGIPEWASNHVHATLEFTDIFPDGSVSAFAKGDSMIGAGIRDKDIIIIVPTSDFENGDIVLAEIDGMMTVKTIKFDDKKSIWLLTPENENYQPIECCDENIFIRGIIDSVVRKMRRSRRGI